MSKIIVWQKLTYEFSFHSQHELGWPVYIIEKDKRGVRKRPKINLKGKSSQQAKILEGTFDNNKVGQEAKKVVVANWVAFQKLAKAFYEGNLR
ncbi:MAG: hypothetical protein KZQ95_02435 [Candidatus Thiodiazotropha sp. (ex Epidulcina cf. delphinae)]|nr:hypothetical protein [Candidatus Thiodiazotropha sp. (ex Epidulcina cf. delphinae)]